jgi:hypothetical protein
MFLLHYLLYFDIASIKVQKVYLWGASTWDKQFLGGLIFAYEAILMDA